MTTPTCDVPPVHRLRAVARQLCRWQHDPWPGHLHPGDLGWHSSVGPERMARDLRVWSRGGAPVAIGMFDGPDVLRLALDPALVDDEELANRLARDLDSGAGLFSGQEAVVEARGARALSAVLRAAGWDNDEPWIPMTLDLSGALDLSRLERSGLRVEQVGADAADLWTSIHWSSFKGTPYDAGARARFVERWTVLMTGPFADRAISLLAHDRDGTPVAVTCVWTSTQGRPGLVEPMGVHRAHHGRGYAVAITLAGARALQESGASSAAVVAEGSNPAALATYQSSGFIAHGEVSDLKRPL